jgi:DNA-binding NtrC family response regulator
MIGRHPLMQDVYRIVRRAAGSDLPVLIVGETGTGKELVARALHQLCPRPDGPFIDVNCAAIPETLADAELFGWERGAFTGAHQRTAGLLEAAHGGMLFLDEACSLPPGVQAKLLRAIELKDFRRVGGRTRCHADFRVIAAVSEPVDKLVREGRLRDDFAYRIAGISVELPRLRDRGADLRLLAESFLNADSRNGNGSKELDQSALELLGRYDWPGNVRELKTLMERLDLLVDAAVVTSAQLRPHLNLARPDPQEDDLVGVLQDAGWDATKAARALQVGRTKLYALMKQYGVRRPETAAR